MDNKPTDLQPGEMSLTAGGDRKPYNLVEEMVPLKAHISRVQKGEGQNWETKLPEPRLILSFKLDEEGDGRGQVYNAYYKPSMNEKANLYKVAVAALDTFELPLDPTLFQDALVRIMLENKTKDGVTRQYVNQVLKPVKGQVILEDIEEDAVDYDSVFPE